MAGRPARKEGIIGILEGLAKLIGGVLLLIFAASLIG
jgi:hypothetical protein